MWRPGPTPPRVAPQWLITYLSIFLAFLLFTHSAKKGVKKSSAGFHAPWPTKKSGRMALWDTGMKEAWLQSCTSMHYPELLHRRLHVPKHTTEYSRGQRPWATTPRLSQLQVYRPER